MKSGWRWLVALVALSSGALIAQQGGTVNTLSVNPRQNIEMTNSTGTETGQPSESVPGSENQPSGLAPSNTRPTPALTNNQQPAAAKPNASAQQHPAEKNQQEQAKPQK